MRAAKRVLLIHMSFDMIARHFEAYFPSKSKSFAHAVDIPVDSYAVKYEHVK